MNTKTKFSIFTSAVAVSGSAQEVCDAYEDACLFGSLDIKAAAAGAAKRAQMLLSGESVKTGTYNLLVPPAAACELLSVLAPVFSAANIIKGKSFLINFKPGSAAASEALSLRDDALLDYRAGSYSADSEGTPGSNKVLIEKGILKGFLSDRLSAAILGIRPSGNAVRHSFKSMPEPGPSNFYIQPGKRKAKEAMKRFSGIIVNSFMGLHTADPVSGNFSLGINGFMSSGGKIKGAVKEALASGNMEKLLENVREVCSDLKFYSNFGSPTIIISDIMLSGSKKQ